MTEALQDIAVAAPKLICSFFYHNIWY